MSPLPARSCLEPLDDRVIALGLELLEGERLELVHEAVQPDSFGERRVDVHRLARDAAALFGARDEVERPHVVEAVGELDEQNADVVGHRQQELAEILRRALVRRHRRRRSSKAW